MDDFMLFHKLKKLQMKFSDLALTFKLRFNRFYFLLFISLLIIEINIALFVHDNFIRPNIGDFLVVILIYCFVHSFFKISVNTSIWGILFFAFFVELLQYFNIVKMLNLQENELLSIIIGNSFSIKDLMYYSLGLVFVYFVEKIKITRKKITV